ncbi:23S rRNA (guanosine(2251)-2'-O)-methyltransferase RlmB [Tomitella gaofuii]|uniref:23S rRNA (guanosine(2251)-2'-O)-methyltransferase RlmB n=1 Tax=Tomitella gaofuii TaxID=2760083 RepID=UPI0015FC6B47|nr:23S rRNA (guanosine(2251)-2'-O)-methyltransferase RlmB [Tomitella gaofuii]
MAGNSSRRGAIRKSGTKKGQVSGSGGKGRRSLRGRGATPPKEMRPYHPAAKKAAKAAKTAGTAPGGAQPARRQSGGARRGDAAHENVLGRNPVLECLRQRVPATTLFVAVGTENDERLTEAVQLAAEAGISIQEVPRTDLDRMSTGGVHQGVALQIPPFRYAHPDELLDHARGSGRPPLFVALDNITDPRNLGAVIRSVAAFGGDGVLIPERRSASVTAVAWRTSAGAAARVPVAKATNMTRTLKSWQKAGFQVAGLDAGGETSIDDLDVAVDPLVLVVGSEGKGLSRLVRETCDRVVNVPMAGEMESLNASVAAGVVLAEVARQRRAQ